MTELFEGSKIFESCFFGSYPQGDVDLYTLKYLRRQYPFNKTWKDYGFYIDGEVKRCMFYKDVWKREAGERYRGVYIENFRPYKVTRSSHETRQDAYYLCETYWFKWEPIRWRVLSRTNDKALLIADKILDSRHYYLGTEDRDIDGRVIQPNSYEYSDIRKWLNDTFYEQAFTQSEKEGICTARLSEDVTTIAYEDDNSAYISDKVFLPSYFDVINAEYGFTDANCHYDLARVRKCTSYAHILGVLQNWWLRTSSKFFGDFCYGVADDGDLEYGGGETTSTDIGVVPEIIVKLGS